MNAPYEAEAENAVIGELRSIHQAQIRYESQFGRYASTFAELGLASDRAGYAFTLVPTDQGFAVRAVPKFAGGRKMFRVDEAGAIKQAWVSEAAAEK